MNESVIPNFWLLLHLADFRDVQEDLKRLKHSLLGTILLSCSEDRPPSCAVLNPECSQLACYIIRYSVICLTSSTINGESMLKEHLQRLKGYQNTLTPRRMKCSGNLKLKVPLHLENIILLVSKWPITSISQFSDAWHNASLCFNPGIDTVKLN